MKIKTSSGIRTEKQTHGSDLRIAFIDESGEEIGVMLVPLSHNVDDINIYFGLTPGSEEGRKRYPPSGLVPRLGSCICLPSCDDPCHGQCGCTVCQELYCDALDALERGEM